MGIENNFERAWGFMENVFADFNLPLHKKHIPEIWNYCDRIWSIHDNDSEVYCQNDLGIQSKLGTMKNIIDNKMGFTLILVWNDWLKVSSYFIFKTSMRGTFLKNRKGNVNEK